MPEERNYPNYRCPEVASLLLEPRRREANGFGVSGSESLLRYCRPIKALNKVPYTDPRL